MEIENLFKLFNPKKHAVFFYHLAVLEASHNIIKKILYEKTGDNYTFNFQFICIFTR
jgi:hypothetical protein